MPASIRALSPGSSLSSYDFFSHSRLASSGESDEGSYGTASDEGSSDDEILLSFSDLSAADFLSQRGDVRTPAVFSDDGSEFVLMSRPRSPAESESASEGDDLTSSFSALSLASQASERSIATHSRARPRTHRRIDSGSSSKTECSDGAKGASGSPKKRNRKRRAAATQAPGNALVPAHAHTKGDGPASLLSKHHSPSKARRKARRAAARAATPSAGIGPAAGLGDRPIVDDVSEVGSESPYVHPELYESAQRYVSSVLSADRLTQSNMPKLAFLQALIIELGLYSPVYDEHTRSAEYPSLPNSLRAAKAVLKSQAFVNIRDYLAVRSQGIDALRSVMHPSRSALLREIRGGKRAQLKTVKDSGLGVLLVTCYR